MKCQLLQFEASKMDDYDQLALLEDELIQKLQTVAIVDGHDFGAGEFNIFLLTDDPRTAFSEAQCIVTDARDYVILWPESLTEFTIM